MIDFSLVKKRLFLLKSLSEKLKSKFFGIDLVIDEVFANITSWYVLPELVKRPVVVCMWGMTGVGKTSLVREIVSGLGMLDKFLEVQMYTSDDRTTLIKSLLDGSYISCGKPGIVLLDEMQNYRTVKNGEDFSESRSFSDVWYLLSDGVFPVDPNSRNKLMSMLLDGMYFSQQVSDSEEERTDNGFGFKRMHYQACSLKSATKCSETVESIMKWSVEEREEAIQRALNSESTYEADVYGNLLVFVLGNLDEAYSMARSVSDAEVDADIFNEAASKITVVDIKSALTARFRPEHISRLGNIHVIYPSLRRSDYVDLIVHECNEMFSIASSFSELSITYDKSLVDFIYRNGVFPTQGVRPVLSTISGVGSVIPEIVLEALEKGSKTIVFSSDGSIVLAALADGYVVERSVPINIIDKARDVLTADHRCLVAFHEAGHGIVYALLFGVSPTQLNARSSLSGADGFVGMHEIVGSRDNLIKKVTILLAGRVCEEMMFGESMVSDGSSSDITTATAIAVAMIRDYGMGDFLGKVRSMYNSPRSEEVIHDGEKSSNASSYILRNCRTEALELLRSKRAAVVALSKVLLSEGSIDPVKFCSLVSNYNITVEVKSPGYIIEAGYGLLPDLF
ncbi:MAG: hypothetical protein GY861_21450 [bacterium]|nr:hypothetical protein [bacterium]